MNRPRTPPLKGCAAVPHAEDPLIKPNVGGVPAADLQLVIEGGRFAAKAAVRP
jgi:hypothetical protein